MKGIDIVNQHCQKYIRSFSIAHYYGCEDILGTLKQKEINYDDLGGCPTSYGLDNYLGLCKLNQSNDEPDCKECWRKALEGDIDELGTQ